MAGRTMTTRWSAICRTFNLNGRAASIDTPLHSLLPFAHVDHVHPDAIIALAASSGGEAATQEIWGGKIGWLPWKRPGYTLGRDAARLSARQSGRAGRDDGQPWHHLLGRQRQGML
jgi:rhamnose utilization protein RhaD (predicted bifunctional aldolase and dehydrogenase)